MEVIALSSELEALIISECLERKKGTFSIAQSKYKAQYGPERLDRLL